METVLTKCVVFVVHARDWNNMQSNHEIYDIRDHSGYGFIQWGATLRCNVVSHWLSPNLWLSLNIDALAPNDILLNIYQMEYLTKTDSCHVWILHYERRVWSLNIFVLTPILIQRYNNLQVHYDICHINTIICKCMTKTRHCINTQGIIR